MSYRVFKNKVDALIKRAGGNIKVRFYNDEESGRYFAKCSDGTTIVGNSTSLRVSVRWNGGNHRSYATL